MGCITQLKRFISNHFDVLYYNYRNRVNGSVNTANALVNVETYVIVNRVTNPVKWNCLVAMIASVSVVSRVLRNVAFAIRKLGEHQMLGNYA